MKKILILVFTLILQSCSSIKSINLNNTKINTKRADFIELHGQPDYTKSKGSVQQDVYISQAIEGEKVSCTELMITYTNGRLTKKEDISKRTKNGLVRCLKFANMKSQNNRDYIYSIYKGMKLEDLIYKVGLPDDQTDGYSRTLTYKILPNHKSNECKTFDILVINNIVEEAHDVTTASDQADCNREANRIAILKKRSDAQAAFLIGAAVTVGALYLTNGSGSGSSSGYNSYSGNCPCPYSVAADGSLCGKRSAYSRSGGAAPRCY